MTKEKVEVLLEMLLLPSPPHTLHTPSAPFPVPVLLLSGQSCSTPESGREERPSSPRDLRPIFLELKPHGVL